MLAMALALATTGGGYLLVLAIIVPVIGMLLSLVVGGRLVERRVEAASHGWRRGQLAGPLPGPCGPVLPP